MMMYERDQDEPRRRRPRAPRPGAPRPGAPAPGRSPFGPFVPAPQAPGGYPGVVQFGGNNLQGLLANGQRASAGVLRGLLNAPGIQGMYGSPNFLGNIPDGMDPTHMAQLANNQFLRSLRMSPFPWSPIPMNMNMSKGGDDPNRRAVDMMGLF